MNGQGTSATAPAAPARSPYIVAMVVSIAAFMEVLDTTITNVSLSHIAGNLAASQDESTWVLTSYLVANGIILPLSGWLSNVVGRKNFFMLCIGGFTAASFACGIANSLPMLIAFRLIQGLAGGGLQPTQQAIITDSFPPEKRGAAFAITGITMIVAPILGPTLGGFITDNYSWRWIFYMNVPVGLLALFLVNRFVEDPAHAKAQGAKSIDYVGLGLIAVGLGALQIMLDKGQEDDWFSSSFIIMMAFISFTSIAAAVIWLLQQEDPIVDLRLLKRRSFGLSCIMIFFVGFTLYGCSTLLPLLVQSSFGYDATTAGLVLSPGGLAVIIFMPISGRLVAKVQARYLVAIGMVLCSVGMFMTMHVTPQTDYDSFVMMRIMQVSGLPFLFVPTSTLAFADIPKEKSGKASALYSLMRNLGGGIGISLLSSLVTRHQQMHQTVLAEHLAAQDPVYRSTLAGYANTLFSHGHTAASAATQSMGLIYRQLLSQSSILAYADAFQTAAILMLSLAFVALILMPSNNPHKKPAAAGAAH
jgi:DHA2 family multidrug resistance protein